MIIMLFWFRGKFSSVGACGTWVRISLMLIKLTKTIIKIILKNKYNKSKNKI